MKKQVRIIRESGERKRISFGMELLIPFLKEAGRKVSEVSAGDTDWGMDRSFDGDSIYIGTRGRDPLIGSLEDRGLLLYHTKAPEGEGYYLARIPGIRLILVIGGSDTGALYGCLELLDQMKENQKKSSEQLLPLELAYSDAPVYRLRGPAIGLQLTKVEPPRLTYEYPITCERFPWFYDQALWIQFLDQLLMERCNCLYIWTGLPFSSLIKLDDYPEALEVTEEQYQKNRAMFTWLTEECDKRGIWLVLKFYSIHIPLPLAQSRHVELLQSRITSLNRDYTYQSIVTFITSFPHIGLMVCLGEALRGTQNKTDWFLDTILPAVKEGTRKAGLTEEPPLILRGHDCDPNAIMEQAVSRYGNLYTMWKYNGEGLTTYLPAGKWQETHKKLASHGQTHIMNVHVVANLEPFRFAAAEFIQKCVQAGRDRMGGSGLHLYPLFFWDWPYSPDRVQPRLLQMERDWLWYKAWFRYAWNPDRDRESEECYWRQVLKMHFDCSDQAAEQIRTALNAAGECAPRILRRIGITEGNRQTMSLGMTMSQLTNARRYRPNYELFHSVSTPGEELDEYIQKEVSKQPHFGETPKDMIREVTAWAELARTSIRDAAETAGANQKELEYWQTDIEAIYEMTLSYTKKLEAAFQILTYRYTMDEHLRGDLTLLEAAQKPWEESMKHYRRLAALTEKTYLYANSMQTPQRKIPFPNGETFGHWSACLPEYERELKCFLQHLQEMKQGQYPGEAGSSEGAGEAEALSTAEFTLLSPDCSTYQIQKGEEVFTDMHSPILTFAPELRGLTGIRFGLGKAITDGITIRLFLPQDSQILLAYMNAKGVEWLHVPDLETNTHADDRGGLSPVFLNAMQAEGCPDMNIHVFQYEKGEHEIYMGTGGYTIAGIVPAGIEIHGRNAGLFGETLDKLDWLYENE